ncbi:secreted protein [Candidatus Magnetomorum sp. HK-1]|nr:secreted protein [Candidatus Magnetomorum sp. HK-1]
MRFKSLLLFLLISIPCCLTKPETRDFSENQKFQPVFTKTNIQAKKSELKSIKRKPKNCC